MSEKAKKKKAKSTRRAPVKEPKARAKSDFRAGFVALVGPPNAGKSTLLNILLESKVSIVSDKPQTTRSRVTGIVNQGRAQAVFVDAPGSLKSTSGINKYLRDELADVTRRADLICILLAADTGEHSAEELIDLAEKAKKPWFAIITKADLLGGTRTPKFFNLLIERKVPFVSISALKREHEARAEILGRVLPLLPESDGPLYDEEYYTTQTVRQMAAEFVRGACFENLHHEIPYGLAVRITEFNENEPMTRIRADIVLDKENHKPIVIGVKGGTIKKIGSQARADIERVLGRQVFLELRVRVHENWSRNPRMMKELGYVVGKD